MTSQDTFGERLKSVREHSGFTVDYVARMIDVKPHEIEQWENGETHPDDSAVSLLSKLYGVDLQKASGQRESPDASDRTDENSETEERRKASPPHPDAAVPDPVRRVFRTDIESNERILWHGHPHMGQVGASLIACLLQIAFVLLFYFIWSIGKIRSGELRTSTVLLHTGLIAVFFFSMELWKILKNARTHYLITDRRVMIRGGILQKSFIQHRFDASFSPRLCPTVKNRGMIFLTLADYRFATESDPSDSKHTRQRRANPSICHVFVDIPDASEVFRIMTDAARAVRSDTESETAD